MRARIDLRSTAASNHPGPLPDPNNSRSTERTKKPVMAGAATRATRCASWENTHSLDSSVISSCFCCPVAGLAMLSCGGRRKGEASAGALGRTMRWRKRVMREKTLSAIPAKRPSGRCVRVVSVVSGRDARGDGEDTHLHVARRTASTPATGRCQKRPSCAREEP